MAEISVGDAIGSGFQLIGQRPLTVAVWGLVRIGFAVAVFAVFAPFYIALFSAIAQSAASGSSSPPDTSTFMPQMMAMQGMSYLLQIVGLIVSAVLYCAVSRAVLHPERSAFAYLRVGAPELYVAVLIFGASIAIAIGLLILMIPFIIVVSILAASKAYAAAVGLAVLGVLALIAAAIYFALRFSFVVPMMVDDGQFHLFESWNLTKGRVGSLFMVGLGLFFVILLAEIVIALVVAVLVMVALSAMAGGLANLPTFFQQQPMTVVTRLAPLLIVLALGAIPISGCALAITGAPWARAYRDVARPAAPTAPAFS